jgi:hypothetical protein
MENFEDCSETGPWIISKMGILNHPFIFYELYNRNIIKNNLKQNQIYFEF